jgi:2-phosphosulfolactate phosphatase
MLQVEVVYTPQAIARLAERDLSSHLAVAIDVFRATSTVVTGLASGATAFFPIATVEEGLAFKQQQPDALLAGERKGEPPAGFDLGNSPREFTPERVRGRRIFHTTTNGTQALVAVRGARQVITAAWLNLSAAVNFIREQNRPTLLLCAGTGRAFALEDATLASAIIDALDIEHPARSIYRSIVPRLPDVLSETRNGRNLQKANRVGDIEFCIQRDKFDLVPKLGADGWITV